MNQALVGGKPYTLRIVVSDSGGEYILPCESAYLIFRTLSGTAQLYWDQATFQAGDPARSVTLNGDVYAGEFSCAARCRSIWLTGSGAEIELTVVSHS